MLLTVPGDHVIAERLADGLAGVAEHFTAELGSSLSCVNDLVTHLERYRGKMMRPTLVLISGMAAAPDIEELPEAHRVVATVMELVHMATLVHDDVLDESELRRSGKTINRLRGNETAVMLGDYLVSHAYHLCAGLDMPHVARIISQATNRVCEGELYQLANRDNWQLDEQAYFRIILDKTACLCGTCCRLGATLSGATDQIVEALHDYGEKLGQAFQIIDDLLDLVGSEDAMGKTLGLDLAKGKPTLPLIHFLKHAASGPRGELERLIALCGPDQRLNADAMDSVRQLLHAGGSVAYTQRIAADLVKAAQTALQKVPESAAKSLLLEVADAVLVRNS